MIAYFLSISFLFLISILPWKIAYLFSDFLAFVVGKILKYRKKVIETNLRNSFPNISNSEIEKITNDYYHFLCDVIIETVKLHSIKKNDIHSLITFKNPEVIQKIENSGQSYFYLLGHFGNWEWASLPYQFHGSYPLYNIYKTLHNPYFDQLIKQLRSKFGAELIPMQQIARHLSSNKNIPTATALVADQTPSPENAYWTTFLNQETAVFKGPAKLAQKYNCALVYSAVKKIKRGKYEIVFELITDKPKEISEEEILDKFMKFLEKDIQESPSTWLWSHKRWKHKKKIS